jgi:hypothetical protein
MGSGKGAVRFSELSCGEVNRGLYCARWFFPPPSLAFAQTVIPTNIAGSTATGIALSATAVYKVGKDNQWPDYERVVIIPMRNRIGFSTGFDLQVLRVRQSRPNNRAGRGLLVTRCIAAAHQQALFLRH